MALKQFYWHLLGEVSRRKTAIRRHFRNAPPFLLNTNIASFFLQFAKKNRFITDKINGQLFSYELETPDGQSLFFEQRLDNASLCYALDLLQPKEPGYIIDIGSSHGWHAIFLASKLPSWHVLVIEASDVVDGSLKKNLISIGLQNISIATHNDQKCLDTAISAFRLSNSAKKCALVRISHECLDLSGICDFIQGLLADRPDFLLKIGSEDIGPPQVVDKLVKHGYRGYRLNSPGIPTPQLGEKMLAGEYLFTLDATITPDDLLLAFAHHPARCLIRSAFVIGAHRFDELELFDYAFPNLEHLFLFEPLPEMVSRLRELADSDSRIQVFATAISDRDGEAVFHVTTNDGMSSSLLEMGSHKDHFPDVSVSSAITVPTLRFESVLTKFSIPPPDLIFLDVQGAEFLILSSIPKELLVSAKAIYTETSKEEIYAGSKLLTDLVNLLLPEFELVAFYPINNALNTHGNALFLNTLHIRNQNECE